MRCTPRVVAAAPDTTSVWMGCSASAPWLPTTQTTTAGEHPAQQPAGPLPFGTSLLPRRAHEQEAQVSGPALWVVYLLGKLGRPV